MNTFFIILFIILVIILILAILYFHMCNKFTESIIRIQEAEIRIDNNIRDKYDLLNKMLSLAKNIITIDDKMFDKLLKLKAMKISSFDMDRTLVTEYNQFLALYDDNSELRENDEIYKANKQIELIDDELVTLKNYYNANTMSYNRMVKKIPTSIIAKIKKYKEKNGFDSKDMNDNDYEDFKL